MNLKFRSQKFELHIRSSTRKRQEKTTVLMFLPLSLSLVLSFLINIMMLKRAPYVSSEKFFIFYFFRFFVISPVQILCVSRTQGGFVKRLFEVTFFFLGILFTQEVSALNYGYGYGGLSGFGRSGAFGQSLFSSAMSGRAFNQGFDSFSPDDSSLDSDDPFSYESSVARARNTGARELVGAILGGTASRSTEEQSTDSRGAAELISSIIGAIDEVGVEDPESFVARHQTGAAALRRAASNSSQLRQQEEDQRREQEEQARQEEEAEDLMMCCS